METAIKIFDRTLKRFTILLTSFIITTPLLGISLMIILERLAYKLEQPVLYYVLTSVGITTITINLIVFLFRKRRSMISKFKYECNVFLLEKYKFTSKGVVDYKRLTNRIRQTKVLSSYWHAGTPALETEIHENSDDIKLIREYIEYQDELTRNYIVTFRSDFQILSTEYKFNYAEIEYKGLSFTEIMKYGIIIEISNRVQVPKMQILDRGILTGMLIPAAPSSNNKVLDHYYFVEGNNQPEINKVLIAFKKKYRYINVNYVVTAKSIMFFYTRFPINIYPQKGIYIYENVLEKLDILKDLVVATEKVFTRMRLENNEQ